MKQDVIHSEPLIRVILTQMRPWWVTPLFVLLGATSFYAASYLITPIYESYATLAFASRAGSSTGVGNGTLGSVMALAGLSNPDASERAEAIATLESRSLIQHFIERDKLLPVLFAEEWHEGDQAMASKRRPTSADAYRLFKSRILSISDNLDTGLIKVTVAWREPKQAARWLADYIALANHQLQDRAITSAETNLTYLNRTLNEANTVEIRSAVAKLMESEMKALMMAKGRADYAFRIIDPPFVPDRPSKPNRLLMFLLGAFLGLTIAIIQGLLRFSFRSGR